MWIISIMLDEATTGMQAHLVKKHALEAHLEKKQQKFDGDKFTI